MQVLVVEDDVDIAELVAFNLERQGWECGLVHHGSEGWGQIQRQCPDLVILDVMLPGMDGIEILQKIRKNPAMESIPVIMASARGTEYDKVLGLDLESVPEDNVAGCWN